MTPLRQQLIQELVLRGLSDRTQEAYVHQVYQLAKFYRQSPDQLSNQQVRQYLFHLAHQRKLAASTVNQAVNAFRSFITTLRGVIWRRCAAPCPSDAKRFTVRRFSALKNWKSFSPLAARIPSIGPFS